jgi:signal transduction histidine kinase
MSASPESDFASEYQLALTEHLKQAGSVDTQRLSKLDELARSLRLSVHEIVAGHAESLRVCLPETARARDYTAATEFLKVLCQLAEAGTASERERFLRKVAHTIRTPLTTLRLSLQVGVGRLEKGEPITVLTLQKAIDQVDKLTAEVRELFDEFEAKDRPAVQPRR